MRLLLTIVGFASAIFGSPWLTALCIIALVIRYPAWEAILLAFMMDLMWLPSEPSLGAFPYFTVVSILLVWVLEPLRMRFLQ
jgi:hypothetical protein